MNRFSWADNEVTSPGEKVFLKISHGAKLYDGSNKTTFEDGSLVIGDDLIIWNDQRQKNRTLKLPVALVVTASEESGSLFKGGKVVVRLLRPSGNQEAGPCVSSHNDNIKISLRSGQQHSNLCKAIVDAVKHKSQASTKPDQQQKPLQNAPPKRHVGIGGIERKMEEKYKESDKTINEAFHDLDALIVKAKDMVSIASKFTSKLQDKQVSMTDDETMEFKTYLLSMGIENPVTKQSHGKGSRYHVELSRELASFLSELVENEGGIMTLSDVYCRFNRARGMELVSPEDVVLAAQQFETLKLPLRLRWFDSGVLVIQSLAHSEEQVVKATYELVNDWGSLTAEQLAGAIEIGVALAKERLLCAERNGKLCRDDCVEGLRFYPNRFLIT